MTPLKSAMWDVPDDKRQIAAERLRNAAPDLLRCLERWVQFAEQSGWEGKDCESRQAGLAESRAAIAKAKGETK